MHKKSSIDIVAGNMNHGSKNGSRYALRAVTLGRTGALLTAIVLLVYPTAALAHGDDQDQTPVIQDVIGEVGDVKFPISCADDDAQATFNRAVALLHHMTYDVAEREFAKVAAARPKCAMAHWGIAMTLVHPVWPGQPAVHALERGASHIELARTLEKTSREAGYVEALAAFYDDWKSLDHATRLWRWDQAQATLRKNYPDDDEALALAAIVHIAAAPKDDLHYRNNRAAGAELESLRARRPMHPGANHYLIHAYDNPPLAAQALDVARNYDRIAPDVPHALHMPSHIFTRLGLWSDSALWNIRSREAARKLLVDGAIYLEFAHASDYLTYAYLQAGRDADARTARTALFEAPRIQDDFAAAYGFAAVSTRIELELADWAGAAAITPRRSDTISWDKYPSCEAIVYFARGLGAARSGQLESARAAVAMLDALTQKLEAGGSAYWMKQSRIQKQVVEAWIDYAEGRAQTALLASAAAADAEDALDKHPVTPGNVLPARELLADMLFALGRFDEALAAYEATLRINPNRYNSLAGAAAAAQGAGRAADARQYSARLLEIAGGADSSRPGVARARSLLSAQASTN